MMFCDVYGNAENAENAFCGLYDLVCFDCLDMECNGCGQLWTAVDGSMRSRRSKICNAIPCLVFSTQVMSLLV